MDYALYFKDGSNLLVKENKVATVQQALKASRNFYVGDTYISIDSVSRFEPIKREEPKNIAIEAGEYRDASHSFFGIVLKATYSYYNQTKHWVFSEGILNYADQFGLTIQEVVKNINDIIQAVDEQPPEWKMKYNTYMMASDNEIALSSWAKEGLKHRTLQEEKNLWVKLNNNTR
jgi:hypothetical protein